MTAGLYVLLVHGPVLGPQPGHLITTAVTPLDVTDIARSCRTFGVRGYGIVEPDPNQQALARRIQSYWMQRTEGPRADRVQALERVEVFASLTQAYAEWGPGTVVATSAAAGPGTASFAQLRQWAGDRAMFLLFGTGYGLAPDTISAADYIAPAIRGSGDFAHLSVRSAVAIILDRIVNA